MRRLRLVSPPTATQPADRQTIFPNISQTAGKHYGPPARLFDTLAPPRAGNVQSRR